VLIHVGRRSLFRSPGDNRGEWFTWRAHCFVGRVSGRCEDDRLRPALAMPEFGRLFHPVRFHGTFWAQFSVEIIPKSGGRLRSERIIDLRMEALAEEN
jgi:hypothetical protein